MTGLGGSRPIQQRMAYVQDQAPTDRRDGVMWLDTSDPQRPLYQWSVSAGDWEHVVRVFDGAAPSNPRDGDIWTDRSQDPPVLKQYDESVSDWRRTVPVAEQSNAPSNRDVSIWIDDNDDLYVYSDSNSQWEKPIPSRTQNASETFGYSTVANTTVPYGGSKTFYPDTVADGARFSFGYASTNSDVYAEIYRTSYSTVSMGGDGSTTNFLTDAVEKVVLYNDTGSNVNNVQMELHVVGVPTHSHSL